MARRALSGMAERVRPRVCRPVRLGGARRFAGDRRNDGGLVPPPRRCRLRNDSRGLSEKRLYLHSRARQPRKASGIRRAGSAVRQTGVHRQDVCPNAAGGGGHIRYGPGRTARGCFPPPRFGSPRNWTACGRPFRPSPSAAAHTMPTFTPCTTAKSPCASWGAARVGCWPRRRRISRPSSITAAAGTAVIRLLRDSGVPFSFNTADGKAGDAVISSDYFAGQMRAILDLFDGGMPVDRADTEEVIALRQAVLKAAAQPLRWVRVVGS